MSQETTKKDTYNRTNPNYRKAALLKISCKSRKCIVMISWAQIFDGHTIELIIHNECREEGDIGLFLR